MSLLTASRRPFEAASHKASRPIFLKKNKNKKNGEGRGVRGQGRRTTSSEHGKMAVGRQEYGVELV